MPKNFRLFSALLTGSLLLQGGLLHASELYVNFNGYHTPAGQLSTFKAMLVDNGKVLATGNAKELLAQHKSATVINLQGKTLLPGLIDGHGHITGLGLTLQRVSLRGVLSEKAAANIVAKFANDNPQLSWIRGRGWNQVLWQGQQYPVKEALDEIIDHKPVWLRRIDGHAGWANSNALALAGIDRHTISPAGGEIIKDSRGEPTGVLIDNAMNLLEIHIPKNSVGSVKVAIEQAAQHLLKSGITSVHYAGINTLTYQAYLEMSKINAMPIRVYGMLSATTPGFDKMLQHGKVITDDDMLNISSVKISADGALGSRGAAMLAPYSDAKDHHGLLLLPPEQLEQLMETSIAANFQVNVHAIGDKANHLALNLFEKFNQKKQSRQLRHRIEHAQVVKVSDLARFKMLNVLPSMQPTHATSDMNMAKARIGQQRLKGAYAWKTLLDDGVRIISGSDFPIEYVNPFYGLHAAVTRQNRKNQPANGWIKSEAMSLTQALTSFTIDAAYGAHQETVIGSLESGKWADFIVIEQDIFKQPETEIWRANVLSTWIAGKKVYQK